MTDTTTTTPPNLVRFGRRSSRGLLLGFSAARVACIAAAATVFIPSMMIAGILGVAATATVLVSLLAAAFTGVRRRHQRLLPCQCRQLHPQRLTRG